MKKIVFGLVGLFITSLLLVSCGSENTMLSQFSKRKYLKKFKEKNVKYEDKVGELETEITFSNNSIFDNLIKLDKSDASSKLDNNEISIIGINNSFNTQEQVQIDYGIDYASLDNQNVLDYYLSEANKAYDGDTVFVVQKEAPVKIHTHWASIVGFITGLLGGILLGIVFGIIGLSVTSNNPEKFNGKGWAIAGILFSIIWLTVLVLLIV